MSKREQKRRDVPRYMPRGEIPSGRADSLTIDLERADDPKEGPLFGDAAQSHVYAGLMSAEDARRFREGAAYIVEQERHWPIPEEKPGKIRPLYDEWGRLYFCGKYDIPGTSRSVWARTRCFIHGEPEELVDVDGDSRVYFSADDVLTIDIAGTATFVFQNDDILIPSTGRIYLDGSASGNTYITESSGDTISLVAGGTSYTFGSAAIDLSAATSLEIPNAANPTIDAAGEIAVQTTDGFLSYHDGSAERAINPVETREFTFKNPGTEDLTLLVPDKNMTLIKVEAVLRGSSTPQYQFNILHDSDRSAVGTSIFSGIQTESSTTTASTYTSLGGTPAVSGGNIVWLEGAVTSGTVDEFHLTLFYRYDP